MQTQSESQKVFFLLFFRNWQTHSQIRMEFKGPRIGKATLKKNNKV